MKNSFELAMERFGGIKELSAEKKKKIADIESKFRAKIATLELASKAKFNSGLAQNEFDDATAKLAAEIASLKEKCEQQKEKIRDEN
jgi:hypothetical protein